ncbi:hypothetical protein [Nocardia amamiensis]|uniref:hypothetical protein n=1 Tax=Nocardia amamiensis TaxID=404578 RepID=UPI0012F4E881|nr:hypothetical protein [Nocardia amamiensis]
MKADVSAVDREAARVLASLTAVSAEDVAAVVEGRPYGAGAASTGWQIVRPRYNLDGSPLEP